MRKLTQHEFVEKAMLVHGNKYGYDKAKFDGVRSRVILTCPSHGDFEQTADCHLQGRGCILCAEERGKGSTRKSKDKFIDEARATHGFRYNYINSRYESNKKNISIECYVHGFFSQNPKNHILGQGCPICGKRKGAKTRSTGRSKFIEKATSVHDGRYSYDHVTYINSKIPVNIECDTHGLFRQSPYEHMKGSGCPTCSLDFNVFRKSNWIAKGGERIGSFYILRCSGAGEKFFKYGITFTGLKNRYSCSTDMPYDYEVVREVKSHDLAYIWDLEKRFGGFKSKDRYSPSKVFGGSKKECFSNFKEKKKQSTKTQ